MSIPKVTFIVPMPPSANNQLAVVNGRLIKSSKMREFWIEADLKLGRQVNAQKLALAELRKCLRLTVDCRFYFEEKKIWTKDQRVKRMDTKNRLKPVHDVIAERIQIDDSRFWGGYDEKATALHGQPEHVEVWITPYREMASPFALEHMGATS